MATEEAKNGFDQKPLNIFESKSFFERNKMLLTLTFTLISLLILALQLLPYVYGGSLGHFHSTGACGWPNDCGKVNSFSPF